MRPFLYNIKFFLFQTKLCNSSFPQERTLQQDGAGSGLSRQVRPVEAAASHQRVLLRRLALPLLHSEERGELRVQGGAAGPGPGFRRQEAHHIPGRVRGREGTPQDSVQVILGHFLSRPRYIFFNYRVISLIGQVSTRFMNRNGWI